MLKLVLASLQAQRRLPDEVIIADDGSGEMTRRVVESYAGVLPRRVEHCWQTDAGYRKARIMNQALRRATADYLILIDGDMLLHPCFVSDHLRAARPGRYTQGRRVCLTPAGSARRLRRGDSRVRFRDGGFNRPLHMIRNQLLMRWQSVENRSLDKSMGCNQAFWRQDLLEINGFEERFQGWGREDSELCARMHNLGRTRLYLRHWALAYHMYHPARSRNRDDLNQQLLADTVSSGRVRAAQGLDGERQAA